SQPSGLAGPAPAVQRVVRAAAAVLEASPRDRSGFRALHHTYLQPAGTQRGAADLLRLPMSTYRRHLSAGIDELVAILWRREQDLSPHPRDHEVIVMIAPPAAD